MPDTAQREAYMQRNRVPFLPESSDQFLEFYEQRREALADLIRATLA